MVASTQTLASACVSIAMRLRNPTRTAIVEQPSGAMPVQQMPAESDPQMARRALEGASPAQCAPEWRGFRVQVGDREHHKVVAR